MESAHGSTKPDRKTIEKNRRIHMKALCSKLDTLTLHHPMQGAFPALSVSPSLERQEGMIVPLPDRINEATSHIKELQEKIERMKGRKRQLLTINSSMEGGLRFHGVGSPWTKLEVQDLGSGGLKIVAVSSAAGDDRVMFYNLVETLEEEGMQILSANYDVVDGNKALHLIHVSATGARRLEAYELSKILMNKRARDAGA